MRLSEFRASGSHGRTARVARQRSERWFRARLEVLEARCLLSIAPSTVVGRFTFYDQSKYDGNVAGINASDSLAIASDKSALLPGAGQATFTNVTSYNKGINGIMVDITGSHPSVTAADFTFRVGNNNAPMSWSTAPAPTAVSVLAGGGVSGADRVEIVWAAGAIQKQWLEVNVAANVRTGLATSDVYYFGNAVGDSGLGDTATLATVNATDELGARNNPQSLLNNIPLTNIFDYSRDGAVNATDQLISRNNPAGLATAVRYLITPAVSPPVLAADLANDTGPGGVPNTDGITHDATITGTLTAANALVSFQGGLNGGPIATDLLGLVQPGGSFTVSETLLATMNGGTLPDGTYTLHLQALDSQGLGAAVHVLFTLDTAAPTVTVSTMVPFTDDLTPHVTITATGGALGSASLDVDINNDSDFADAGELTRTTSPLLNDKTYFQLTPALPPTNPLDGPYVAKLRARATDLAGNEGISSLSSLEIDTIGSDALANYVVSAYDSLVDGDDPEDHYTLANTVVGTGYTFYALDLTSQTWRSAADVDKPVWRHWVEVIVPNGTISNSALLFITGGNNTSGAPPAGTVPSSPDSSLLSIALATQAVTVKLRTVPSEPLTFTDEAFSRNEDAIIAYTFDKYTSHLGDPGNETWPLLLPMVQSAVRAMDSVQHFVPGIVDFVVSGHSKRGWTTWLTAAVDDRVRSIIPGVIDVLNMDEQMMNHYADYGFWTPQLNDYIAYNIPQEVLTAEGEELGRIVDPYRYLNNGRFDDMPKLALNASGDEFFIPTSSESYFSDLPGTQNYLRYVPNSGHGIPSAEVTTSTKSFFNAAINNLALPQYTWSVQQDQSIVLQTTTVPTSVVMWQATNPTSRDFRRAYQPGITWTSTTLTPVGGNTYTASPPMPGAGATAYFIQMTFTSPLVSDPYIFTTGIQIKSPIPLTAWPFYMPPSAGSAGSSAGASPLVGETAPDAGFVASGLVMMTSSAGTPDDEPAVSVLAAPLTVVEAADASESGDDAMIDWSWADDALDDLASDDDQLGDEEILDAALGLFDEVELV